MGRYIWKTINGEYCTVQDKVDGIIVTTKVAFRRLYEYERLGTLGRFAQLTAENKELRDQFAALQAENAELRAELEEESSRRYQAECNYDHWYEQGLQQQAALSRVEAERDAALGKINAAYEIAWGCDIPSPTIPEYVELHDAMTRVMAALRGAQGEA